MKRLLLLLAILFSACFCRADDGYRLWLRFDRIKEKSWLDTYRQQIRSIRINDNSPTLAIAKQELVHALASLLGKKIPVIPSTSASLQFTVDPALRTDLGPEGYSITSSGTGVQAIIQVKASTDIGILYGAYQMLRLLQTRQQLQKLFIKSIPRIQYRMLDHWDNLNRYVERGYAGISIWDWHKLPDYIDQRYIDYARANASIGINGTVLTNVNANALVLTPAYLEKVAALANVFRPYGIRVYLTARFSAPMEIGNLATADPLSIEVQQWWKQKAAEIYRYIPDFGGFLVKANSEGQPGPQNYNRTHADGANMLADALAPFHGIVLWRAFVYSNEVPDDRVKQAFNEFKPLDGLFRENVILQVKNGPLDFQPREPFHPLFGAMPHTATALELQLTQEYLGQATHLVYLGTMFREILDADTYRPSGGSTVAHVIDGSSYKNTLTAIAGVANIGNDRDWTGHPFAQANWYAFGRLAWNHTLTASEIANEWIRQTFGNDAQVVNDIREIMMGSHEALVNYMTPLGLHHIMGNGHHYGPAPWSDNLPRQDWNPVYYHRADSAGIGFERGPQGSNAVAQYAPAWQAAWGSLPGCPEKYLLWFHHVSWSYRLSSGRSLWEELCHRYYSGVDSVSQMQARWDRLEKKIDPELFRQVKMLLAIQRKEAIWWRNACLLYFQAFSKLPIPTGYDQPDHTLEYYKNLRFPFAPGN